jgi:hypothetical protein
VICVWVVCVWLVFWGFSCGFVVLFGGVGVFLSFGSFRRLSCDVFGWIGVLRV